MTIVTDDSSSLSEALEPDSEAEASAPPRTSSAEPDWDIGPITSLADPDLALEGSVAPTAPDPQPHRLSGALATTVIRDVIRGAHDEMRACYEASSLDADELVVVVRFVIGSTGRTTEVVAQRRGEGSSQEGLELEECLEQAVSALVFPPPPNGGTVTISYPFRFVSSS